jgi:hypothetical protein
MGFSSEQIQAQVDRLVRSKTFETSEVHRRLLQYLAEKSIHGEADRLKEYTVGLEAFGKPDSYDPRHDSIVRLQVGRLRQKLMAYYREESPGDDLVISLPKGGFRLTFDQASAHPAGTPGALQAARRIRLLVVAVVVLAAWAVAATLFWLSARSQPVVADQWTPELKALWQPFLDSDRSLVLCLGTPMFVRFPGYGFVRDPRTNDWEEVQKSARIQAFRKAFLESDIYPAYAFTGAGEASAGVLLARLLATRKPNLVLTRSNLLSWQQISDEDVIFIGPPKFNLQLQAAALRQDIVIEADGIRNLKPRNGEPAFLEDRIVAGRSSEGETHALISRTPGLSGVGVLLTVAGNASPDTQAAAEWLTQPRRARELAARLRGPSGEIPRYFQAVVKVAFKQGIPVQTSYVFHHVLSGDSRGAAKP